MKRLLLMLFIFLATFMPVQSVSAALITSPAGSSGTGGLPTDEVKALDEYTNWVAGGCNGSGGGGGGSTPVSLTGNDNVQKTFNFFVSEGLSTAQAAGVVANFMWETGGGTNVDPLAGGSDPSTSAAFGIAQWTPGSKYVTDKNYDNVTGQDTDLLTQLNVVWDEMNGKSITSWSGWGTNLAQLKQINNAGDAANFFRMNFEGCDVSYSSCTVDRVNLANQLVKQLGNGGGGGGGASTPTSPAGSCGGGSTAATTPGSCKGGGGKYAALVSSTANFAGIDQGIDFTPTGTTPFDICAPASGKITQADQTGHQFDRTTGQAEIIEQLDQSPSAPDSSQYIYYAEIIQIASGITVGTHVNKGDLLGTNNESPGIEVGWALSPTIGFKCPIGIPTPCGESFNTWIQQQ